MSLTSKPQKGDRVYVTSKSASSGSERRYGTVATGVVQMRLWEGIGRGDIDGRGRPKKEPHVYVRWDESGAGWEPLANLGRASSDARAAGRTKLPGAGRRGSYTIAKQDNKLHFTQQAKPLGRFVAYADAYRAADAYSFAHGGELVEVLHKGALVAQVQRSHASYVAGRTKAPAGRVAGRSAGNDVTAYLLADLPFAAPGPDVVRVLRAAPAKAITPSLRAELLRVADPRTDNTIGYISHALAYSKQFRRSKASQTNLVRLLKGGWLRVVEGSGPPPEGSIAKRDSHYGTKFYVLQIARDF